MINPGIELDNIRRWRSLQVSLRWTSMKRLNHMISIARKKTRSFRKRHGGFYICKKCKGSGLETELQSLGADFGGYIDVYFCEPCNGLGLETWLDRMTRGWKGV